MLAGKEVSCLNSLLQSLLLVKHHTTSVSILPLPFRYNIFFTICLIIFTLIYEISEVFKDAFSCVIFFRNRGSREKTVFAKG